MVVGGGGQALETALALVCGHTRLMRGIGDDGGGGEFVVKTNKGSTEDFHPGSAACYLMRNRCNFARRLWFPWQARPVS